MLVHFSHEERGKLDGDIQQKWQMRRNGESFGSFDFQKAEKVRVLVECADLPVITNFVLLPALLVVWQSGSRFPGGGL